MKKDSTIKLLSLPPDTVGRINNLENLDSVNYFCSCDPPGSKLGSGGGTTWIIDQWKNSKGYDNRKQIIIHAGGQSRRLPAYAPEGKIFTPVPVFRWKRGQKLSQNLLSLQLPLFEKIMENAPDSLTTLIASGDVYIRACSPLQDIPQADVVCYGQWVDAALATHHGVFVSDRNTPSKLDFMLQKPTIDELESLSDKYLFLMDIGIWLLSDKAVELLMKRSKSGDEMRFYDLYSDFGRALGTNPAIKDDEINSLTVAILPLPGGEFYHFGTTRELLSSTVALQNLVLDQRKILHNKIKANPSLFVQNVDIGYKLGTENDNVWVENSNVPASWTLTSNHVITGVPVNDWKLNLPSGACVDIVPVEDNKYALRPYGFNDAMRGALTHPETEWMGKPYKVWADERGVPVDSTQSDIQAAPIFPIADSLESAGKILRWMISEPDFLEGADLYNSARKISADEISAMANLERLYAQREAFRKGNWTLLAKNHERSVFYQLDLDDTAKAYSLLNIEKPAILPAELPAMTRIRNLMLRSRIDMRKGADGSADEAAAFALLRQEMLKAFESAVPQPKLNVYSDQIVWARSPVRIDLAGGWTDTPPYSLFAGGNVVNMAIELNGQPPLQVYVKPASDYKVILRSIDLGAIEEVTDYDALYRFNKVGSPFSIPKAALVLAGFSRSSASTLREQLQQFGAGIEITLLSAIPAGSGLGTSSILAATVLGALSDFSGLAWDENEICSRTLALEQLLTTGGGWQDQYGGVLGGVKLLQTEDGYEQRPLVSWLPDRLFNSPEYSGCHVLYYTGLTRTAKNILSEIVRGMFLNSGGRLELLDEMKEHALQMADAIQRNNFEVYGKMVARTWTQNKLLDSGTETPAVAEIINRIKDYTLGYKLPGAGGGGYLYMVAKDPEAAARIRTELTATPPNSKARFVDMTVSQSGFKVSRS